MAKALETLSVVNNLVRTLLAALVVGGVGWVGWKVYSRYTAADRVEAQLADAQEQLRAAARQVDALQKDLAHAQATLQEKQQQIAALERDVARLETSLRLLKVTHRVARLTVLDQGRDESTGEMYTLVRFEEINDEGRPLGPAREFRIVGDVIYLDSWVVKFEDKYIEQADVDRSTTLVLFRRIFGEHQQPKDGYELDKFGVRPLAYAQGGAMTDFERKIWEDFWNIANDPKKAEELGIRAAHGEAPSIKARKGTSYRVMLRASDGLSITVDGEPPVVPGSAS